MSYKNTLFAVKIMKEEGLAGFFSAMIGPTDDSTLNLLLNNLNEAGYALEQYLNDTYIKEDE